MRTRVGILTAALLAGGGVFPRATAAPPLIAGPEASGFVALERVLAPAVDPQGRPWRVEVVPETADGPGGEGIVTAAARPDGTWRHAKVPSLFAARLRVSTEEGDVWWVSPEPFSTAEAERSGRIDLAVVSVRGVARVGKQPLPGLVTFTDDAGLRVRFVSGVDGDFSGALPRAGSWSVRVRSSRVALDRTTTAEVGEPSARRGEAPPPAFVDVRFPDRAIRGEVIDAEGKAVERFKLSIGEAGTSTDWIVEFDDGVFRYERIATGTAYRVTAIVPRRTSATYLVRVPEDDDPEYVRAVIGQRRELRGHVVSTTGRPVPGGRGTVSTVPSGGLDYSWFSSRGDRAEFSAHVSSPTDFACLFLSSPGHAAHLSRQELTTDDHEIVVTPMGGTLVLSAPTEPLRIPALFRGGCALRLSRLSEMRGAIVDDRGGRIEVVTPPVEPGPWSLCLVTRGELEAYKGGDPEFPGCVHGVLDAGESLELELPGAGPPGSS
ncbi:MAG: hypothetical protein RBU36_12560 [Thermoanaerobaculia bacterium]|jgi:hypothetical protein|nr:hypothetical protein [Thermoanaerobaculia bacterium]